MSDSTAHSANDEAPKGVEPSGLTPVLGKELESRSILIVDDLHTSCKNVRELVQALGARSENISICQTLLLAKKRLALSPVDIVISDLHLKDGKGLELLQCPQFTQADIESIFVLMTSNPVSNLMHDSIRLGASTIIVKPITFETLKEHLLFSLSKLSGKRGSPNHQMKKFFERLSRHSPPRR